jgi:hypothetical protein
MVCASCGRLFMRVNGRRKLCQECRYGGEPRRSGQPARFRGTFGERSCAFCGRLFAARTPNQRFCCRGHERLVNAYKRKALYDNGTHRRRRKELEPVVARGLTPCARCGELIRPGEPWDLDHLDGGVGYRGPSHARCNRATSRHRVEREQKRAAGVSQKRLTSREW